MWQSISGTSCSTKRACGQTISRISDVNQHLVFLFKAIDHDIIWPKSEGWFLALWQQTEGEQKSQIHLERWIWLRNHQLQPLFAQWDILQKKALFWLLGPTGSEDASESYWNHWGRRCLYTNLMESIPPNCIKTTRKQKAPSALDSFQSQQISSRLNMSTYGKRQALKLHEVQRRSRATRL